MVAPAFLINRYAPIQLPQQLNQMPQEYLKILTRFTREDEQTTENHISIFCNFAENLNVEHLDVVLFSSMRREPLLVISVLTHFNTFIYVL